MDEYREQRALNAGYWSHIRDRHVAEWYDLDSFRAGSCTLRSVEVDALDEVTGKRLLHLQCNCGLDTLSWARRGAIVTGVDLSDRSIEFAGRLAAEAGIEARFVHADVMDLNEELPEAFDIVFASYGVLCWIDDLSRWMRVAADHLEPGGVLFYVDGHPALWPFDENDRVEASYFHENRPFVSPPDDVPDMMTYEWQWTVADIVNAAIDAGLRIEHLGEYPFFPYDYGGSLRPDGKGGWRPPGLPAHPMLLSLKARRPES